MAPQTQTRPCPVCKEPCIVKFTHKGKPYWQCEPCGVQVFVRRQAGIEHFTRGTRRAGPPEKDDDDFWGRGGDR